MSDKIKHRYVVIDCETNSGAVDGELTDVHCIDFYFPEDDRHETIHGIYHLPDILNTLGSYIPIYHNASFDIWVLEECASAT
jgi:DNA polymerase III epsilon subunit-like protein